MVITNEISFPLTVISDGTESQISSSSSLSLDLPKGSKLTLRYGQTHTVRGKLFNAYKISVPCDITVTGDVTVYRIDKKYGHHTEAYLPSFVNSGIVCGEQARYLTEEQKKRGGLLLDIKAAELLAREGIDVGLSSAADVLSRKNEEKADEPRLWTYENAEKRKYAVLNYDIGSALPNASPDSVELSDVPLQRALAEAYEFLSGSPLPAFALGCPGLYLLACGDKEKLSLLLCNIFPDGIQNPDIFLDGEYRVKRELRAQARTEGNRLLLSRLPAHSYAAVELIKE